MTNRAAMEPQTVRLIASCVERSSTKTFDSGHATCGLTPEHLHLVGAIYAEVAIETIVV
jgi:hypothetical protein